MMRWVLALGLQGCIFGALPTPESYFGHAMGEDRKLVRWEQVVGYFDALDKVSDRVTVERIGLTVDGKPMIAAFLAEAETLRDLSRYRDIQARLSDPRRTSEREAVRLAGQGKTVVMVTCSIHSTEVASTFTAIEYAHRLLTEDTPKHRAILANTIFILVPSLNPDGIDIVYDWYAKTLGTPFEGTSPPELYHRYIGHDNNRDWYIFSQPETRNVIARLHNVWHPQIVYDVHQQGAYSSRMFVPPWMDPIEPNIDPIIAQLCNAIGAGIAADLTSGGKTGVSINAMYDFWTPARHYQAYHGGLRILSESASAKLATPVTVSADEIRANALGYNPRERSWNHLEPWTGGKWRVRDIMEYQLIAFESCLYQAATRREDMLRSFWRIHQRQAERRGAFVIPFAQRDPAAARKLLDTLAFGGIEIEQSEAAYVIRMQQPYSGWAKALLERQRYPDLRLYPDGPPKRPYDVTAHTLPLLMGVEVSEAGEAPPGLTRAQTWRFTGPEPRRGSALRVGLYRSWMPSMDEGWTRWMLEQSGIPYVRLTNDAIRGGRLRERLDVILFPDQTKQTIHEGYKTGAMPPEYTGGLGEDGARALQAFASGGGTLVFLNESTEWAIEQFGLDVTDATARVPEREHYSPGSILRARVDPAHPLAASLPEEVHIWSEQSPAFEVPPGSKARVVVRYPENDILASGWLLGEKYLAGKGALVEVPFGSGRVLLFGMRPQYRAQSYQTFHLLVNALTKH